jgi:hypothetical protein
MGLLVAFQIALVTEASPTIILHKLRRWFWDIIVHVFEAFA